LAIQLITALIAVPLNGPVMMKPEFSRADQERQVSPYAQEIEYALIVQRMINAVTNDPLQMRMTIYEFARARLKIDTSGIDESERERLLIALETAIQGVEQFSLRETERLPSPHAQAQIEAPPPTMPVVAAEPSQSVDNYRTVAPAEVDILVPRRRYARAEPYSFGEARSRPLASMLSRLCFGLLLFGVIGGLMYYKQRLPLLRDNLTPWISSNVTQPAVTAAPAASPALAVSNTKPAIVPSNEPGFPVPSDYGVYALSNNALSELYTLPERVPDKRIAVSTPVSEPSRTTLPDGKARFIVFRRDLVGNAPDRLEIRVVARVARAISFDAKGRPNIASISDSWNIRNVSHEFRVRPVAGNPEMLLIQPDKPDFVLPAGRYVLVLKDQGYDFTVAGKVAEPAQCLERTDAVNGSFYSECLTP
jgi:hypothetical protein